LAKIHALGSTDERFIRPVRWLMALWGECVIPVRFAKLTAGRTSYGHRLIAPAAVEVTGADEFTSQLTKAWVDVTFEMRSARIRAQIKSIEESTGLKAYVPESTFNEVVNLVEYPTSLVGNFDEEYLQVPPEIIIDAMLKHQRYFPLYEIDGVDNVDTNDNIDAEDYTDVIEPTESTEAKTGGTENAKSADTKTGRLANKFIVVSNGSPAYNSIITNGNERVIRPRLSDAAFFYNEDLGRPLDSYVDDLEQVVFHEKLGSLRSKVDRIVELAGHIAETSGATPEQIERSKRTAFLCKADLVTRVVVEFTSLQGIMGGYYAKALGEPAEVANAIEQHYRPRFAGDDVPNTFEGKTVALADKIDTLCGIFAIGQAPTGSSDPFALRRAAIGIINILLSGQKIPLATVIKEALTQYKNIKFDTDEVFNQIIAFFTTRLEVIARDGGYSADVVQAVLASGVFEPVDMLARCETLVNAQNKEPELFKDLATAYARANNLRDAELGTKIDKSLLGEPELALDKAIDKVAKGVKDALAKGQYNHALEFLASLRGPIDTFFDEVMIMDNDETLRYNRLRLLNRFVATFKDVADFGKLAG
jgi:glycyl-tRNA synthetase beta chain